MHGHVGADVKPANAHAGTDIARDKVFPLSARELDWISKSSRQHPEPTELLQDAGRGGLACLISPLEKT
jgi:hypothetical protein